MAKKIKLFNSLVNWIFLALAGRGRGKGAGKSEGKGKAKGHDKAKNEEGEKVNEGHGGKGGKGHKDEQPPPSADAHKEWTVCNLY